MEAKQINGTTLAFIGDAIFSLQVREYLVELGHQRSNVLQTLSVKYVSAKAQAVFLHTLLDQKVLSEEEQLIVKRGRNSKTQTIAKNADVITYRNATGFEALWGYLYLNKEHERLAQLWELVKKMGE